MDYRLLGGSGLKVPALSFGTATFGGRDPFFASWGTTAVQEATRLVDLCLDAGVTLFDTANVYSSGQSEEILGQAVGGRRNRLLIATKATFHMGDGPNDVGSSRHHLVAACEASLKRLGTDYIDLYQLHGFDASTRIDETLRALDDLLRAGKIRAIGCSNFSGWHLMKSLAASDRHGWARYASHQVLYNLLSREYEWELMPLALDQQIGTLVWSPLAGGKLTGKYRRGQPAPADSRVARGGDIGPSVPEERLYAVIDALDEVAGEVGRSLTQVSLAWLLSRPTIASVIVGARTEAQLKDNLGAIELKLTREQIQRLDRASEVAPIYPYWHQWSGFRDRNPAPVELEEEWG